MKLTESQARNAIRKWLFEYTTDSGVSHRASTDDSVAGKLGDDREDQPASTIPPEIPIMAVSQMSTQLTHAMPPIEDPDFIPGTVEELGKSVDMLAQQVPHSEIEWFYEKMQELADEAIENGNADELANLSDLELEAPINANIKASQKSSQEAAMATNENWKRWSGILAKGLTEAKSNPWKYRKELSSSDMKLYRPEEDEYDEGDGLDGKYQPSQGDLEDMADAIGVDLDELPGFDSRTHKTRAQRQAGLATGNFDGEAKLRELVTLGIYPKIRTMSGMRKKISAELDPLVQMWATAKPALLWLFGWLEDKYQLNWGGQIISGPDVYNLAITAYEKFYRKNSVKLSQLADALERGDFYKNAMAEIVLAPIITKWLAGVKDGTIDIDASTSRNNFIMSDWILEVVLEKGFGASGNKRRAGKLDTAMQDMQDFRLAMQLAQQNAPLGDAE